MEVNDLWLTYLICKVFWPATSKNTDHYVCDHSWVHILCMFTAHSIIWGPHFYG